MLDKFHKFKKLFKLNNWKRIFIISFSFISIGLFAGLSFGLYSSKSSPTIEYKNGIQVSIKPTNSDLTTIDDQTYLNQIYYNLSTRLQQEFPNSNINLEKEENGVINVKLTNITSSEQKNKFISKLVNKDKLIVTSIDVKYVAKDDANEGQKISLYNGDLNLSFSGVSNLNNDAYSLNFVNKQESLKIYKEAKRYDSKIEKTLIWKNFDKFKEIVDYEEEQGKDNINNDAYKGSYYAYLFVNGITPEKIKGETNSTKPVLFKEEFKDKNGNIYKVDDFLVSKNEIDDWKEKDTLAIKKDFGASNWKKDNKRINKEYVAIRYWISPYSLNNYLLSYIDSNNGPKAYAFLLVAMISFFALISIFVVLNYGYLGIIAIALLSIIVFLSLLMITTFIGDYDTTTIMSLMLATLIGLDSIVLFFEKVKREVKKGNSIPKAVKNSMKATNKFDYVKSGLLIVVFAIIYIALSQVYATFTLLTLSTIIFAPIIFIFLLRMLSKIFISINIFQNNGKTIGFWRKSFLIKSENNEIIGEDEILIEQIEYDKKNQKEIDNSPKFKLFSKINKNGLLISCSALIILIISSLTVFLTVFFVKGNGFGTNIKEENRIVLRIGKENNIDDETNKTLTNDEINNIKKDLSNNYKISNSQMFVTKSNLLELYLDKNYSKEQINNLTSSLISKYNVKIIESQLINSNTYKTMIYTMYGILVAIILTCLFVLFWMNWTKALTLLVMSIVYAITFIGMVMFGLIVFNPLLSTVLIFTFTLFLLMQLNSLIRYDSKIKTRRIEDLNKNEIKELIDTTTYRNLKSTFIYNGILASLFIIFCIFVGALPTSILLFMLGISLFNLLFNLLLMPKIFIYLESKRAKMSRNRIINKYWETEKVKEQVFSNINNIK